MHGLPDVHILNSITFSGSVCMEISNNFN